MANKVIQNNSLRNNKKLWSKKEASDRARLISCSSNFQEAEAIACLIKQSKNKLNSHAILYRSHAQSRSIEEALLRHCIPYKIIGGIQFYERQEVKDLLAYLRLIVNPYDRLALARILNVPSRTFGEKFEEQMFEFWDSESNLNFLEIMQLLVKSEKVVKSKVEKIAEFIKIFDGLNKNSDTSYCLEQIIRKTSYLNYLDESFEKEEANTKRENVKELISACEFFEANSKNTVQDFLDEISLIKEINEQNENKESVYLMTLHAAKGLEFDVVILAGFEDGILPSSRSISEIDTIEEERRLLYVGITRAKERLLITYSNFRSNYGKTVEQKISRFYDELDRKNIISNDVSRLSINDIEIYFKNWLHQNLSNVPANKEIKLEKPALATTTTWKNYQPVMHNSFGIGIIQNVEQRQDKIFLTIKFSTGLKKLDSTFIKII